MPLAPAVASGLYYLPRFLIDNKWANSTGECSLFVRQIELTEAKRGLRIRIRSDVLTFPDETAMYEAIERHHMIELPGEAEGDQLYVPRELRDEGVTVVKLRGRIVLPGGDDVA